MDHRECKITPSAQLFTIFLRHFSSGFRHGSNGSNNVVHRPCVYLVCKQGLARVSHANNLISFLPHTLEGGRSSNLSLINVSNKRATWLQQRNWRSVGNWSETLQEPRLWISSVARMRCSRRETNLPLRTCFYAILICNYCFFFFFFLCSNRNCRFEIGQGDIGGLVESVEALRAGCVFQEFFEFRFSLFDCVRIRSYFISREETVRSRFRDLN